jgi:phage terminase Nu1 subunit (DNA packaging protein)
MATQSQFAAHVGINQAAVADLVRRGVIESEGRNTIDLDAARLAYIAHLRSLASGGSGDPDADLDLSKERARLAKEQADKQEMLNAVMRGELLERGAVDDAVIAAFARVRAKMLSVPSKCAPLVVGVETATEVQETLRRSVHDALQELSDTLVEDLARQALEE